MEYVRPDRSEFTIVDRGEAIRSYGELLRDTEQYPDTVTLVVATHALLAAATSLPPDISWRQAEGIVGDRPNARLAAEGGCRILLGPDSSLDLADKQVAITTTTDVFRAHTRRMGVPVDDNAWFNPYGQPSWHSWYMQRLKGSQCWEPVYQNFCESIRTGPDRHHAPALDTIEALTLSGVFSTKEAAEQRARISRARYMALIVQQWKSVGQYTTPEDDAPETA